MPRKSKTLDIAIDSNVLNIHHNITLLINQKSAAVLD